MENLGRRAVETLLWVIGTGLAGIGALILWNLARGESDDSGALPFVFGAVMYGVPGVLLLVAARRMHRRTSGGRG